MIGWIYILAIPAFLFLLPLYSFWRMDDFSWGATRVVSIWWQLTGRRLKIYSLKSWEGLRKYFMGNFLRADENGLWDKEPNHSIGSKLKDGYAESQTASIWPRGTLSLHLNLQPVMLLDTSLVATLLNLTFVP
jgi:chitin synthase